VSQNVREGVLKRFLEYVVIDTQSTEEGSGNPSTPGQWDLLHKLEGELKELGMHEVILSEHGVLTALLPATAPAGHAIPTIGFLAHVDTYHGTSGKDVKPQMHQNYDGKDICLPGTGKFLRVAENPELAKFVGDTVITTDGTTLLGADDKAGVAAIMTALEVMIKSRPFIHGDVKVAFTPDEEIGQGAANFPLADFGAHVAYTLDGGPEGEVENETFCADTATVTLLGRDVHPGYAKGKMISAIRAASHLISLLPQHGIPETTEGYQGYLHPLTIQGDVNKVTIPFLVRDFTMEGLQVREATLQGLLQQTAAAFPGLVTEMKIAHSYKNMKYYLEKEPRAVELAMEAVKNCGMEPSLVAIRGGTDGSRLSEMGLPTPNLFAGGRNFHSVQEWIPLGSMEKAVAVMIEISRLWSLQK